jgi:hypothetical protein
MRPSSRIPLHIWGNRYPVWNSRMVKPGPSPAVLEALEAARAVGLEEGAGISRASRDWLRDLTGK